jgi:hypothetical protein
MSDPKRLTVGTPVVWWMPPDPFEPEGREFHGVIEEVHSNGSYHVTWDGGGADRVPRNQIEVKPMSDISKARQALRDAARVKVTIYTDPDPTSFTGKPGAEEVEIGALAHHAFVAAQAALSVAEELRAEADGPINPNLFDWQAAGIELVKHAQREAADRVEAAILKVLKS